MVQIWSIQVHNTHLHKLYIYGSTVCTVYTVDKNKISKFLTTENKVSANFHSKKTYYRNILIP